MTTLLLIFSVFLCLSCWSMADSYEPYSLVWFALMIASAWNGVEVFVHFV